MSEGDRGLMTPSDAAECLWGRLMATRGYWFSFEHSYRTSVDKVAAQLYNLHQLCGPSRGSFTGRPRYRLDICRPLPTMCALMSAFPLQITVCLDRQGLRDLEDTVSPGAMIPSTWTWGWCSKLYTIPGTKTRPSTKVGALVTCHREILHSPEYLWRFACQYQDCQWS